jgi:hypothetical protein
MTMQDKSDKLDEIDKALAEKGRQEKALEREIEQDDEIGKPPKFHPDHARDGGVF